MSEHETEGLHPVEDEDTMEREEPQAVNLMEQMRQQRQEALSDTTVDLPLPRAIYNDPVVLVRCRAVDSKETQRITQKVNRLVKGEFERNLYITMDSLITACEGIYTKPVDAEPDYEPDPLLFNGDGPLMFDERLAEFLGIQATSARETMREFFAGKETAIMIMGARLARWQSGEDPFSAPDEWLLGEA